MNKSLEMASSVKLWLESLVLDQYLAILEDGGFDTLEKCAGLTESCLDRLGITLQGHKKRILSHLPEKSSQGAAGGSGDDIYDVPPVRASAFMPVTEEIYENVDGTSHIPALPPKMGSKSKTVDLIEEAKVQVKRPVPAPRPSKKPVPRPRASKRSTDTYTRSSGESLTPESPRSPRNPSPVVSDDTEYMPMDQVDYVPRRKPSIQLAGATLTESDLDKLGNVAAHARDSPSLGLDPNQESSWASGKHKEENEYTCEPVIGPPAFPLVTPPKPQTPSKPKRATPSVCSPPPTVQAQSLPPPSDCQRAPAPPSVPPPLSMDEIEFFENMDSSVSTDKKQKIAQLPTAVKQVTGISAAATPPVVEDDTFNEPLYSDTVAAGDEAKADIFGTEDEDIFDVNAPIPTDFDEWDKQTVRKSLMIGTKLPTMSLRPDCTGSRGQPRHDLPKKPDDKTIHPSPVELGMEIYDTAVDVNKNLYVSDLKKEEKNNPDHDTHDTELDDNERNEKLYAETKLREPKKTLTNDPYGAVCEFKAKNAEEPVPGMSELGMSPPSFAPPPLPSQPRPSGSPSLPPPRPQDHSPPDIKTGASEPRTLPDPPATPTRPAPPAPSRDQRYDVPSAACRPPIPTPAPSQRLGPLPPVPGGAPPERPKAPEPPKRSGSSLTPPTPHKQDVSPQLPLRKNQTPSPLMMPGTHIRDSFTDLARVRSTHKSQEKSETDPLSPSSVNASQSRPCPPPRTDNPFKPLYDPERGTYSLEEAVTVPDSPSIYEDAHSDNTLSDGGDWFDTVGFQKPSIDVLKEAVRIVPAIQGKTAEKQGYLLKKASQDTMRRVGGTWIKRWVSLDSTSLRYYSSKKHDVTKRIIPVASMLNIEQMIRTGESHPCQFQVITVDRIYTFAADSRDELTLWTNMLMLAIIEMKGEDFEEGGEMREPTKQGYVRMDGIKGRRFLALKKDKLCYYNTVNDFRAGTPIAEIEMKLTTVKDLGKHRLQIVTPINEKTLLMDSDEELREWKEALEEAIADGLGDDSVLNEVYENHSNRFCADCSAANPQWASINLGITLCKRCAGIHRMLTFPISKVRSLRMDFRVWKPSLVQLMQVIGNDNANNFWQWYIQDENKLDSTSDMPARERFIIGKYRNKRYSRLHPLNGDQEALNEALAKSVQFTDVLETMQLFHTGANILSKTKDGKTCIQLAQEYKQSMQEAFLYQNGAEGSGQIPVTTSMVLDNMIIDGCLSISHKGYLYKTGSNVKGDFLKRWCILDQGEFSYYESEKSSSPKDKIGRAEILSVRSTTDPRYEFAFEIATNKHGRVYLFAAELEEDRRKWVSLIAKSIAPVPQDVAKGIIDFSRAGVVFMKRGANQEWRKCWLQWKKSELQYYTKGMKVMENVDCRKIKSLSLVTTAEAKCVDALENGPIFIFNFQGPERSVVTLYIQADVAKETEAWYKLVNKISKEIGQSVSEQPLTSDNVPVIIDKCINFMTLHGMNTQGIYRLNGQHSKVSKLLEDFQKDARGVTLRLEEYQVHDVATVLKRFLRTLGDPLLTSTLYTQWINITSIPEQKVRQDWYQYLLKELPLVNFCTLKKLLVHLSRVAENEADNKMGVTNIASIFGPIAMKVDKDGDSAGYASTSQEIAVFKELLDRHKQILGIEDREELHERKIEEARDKIKHLMSMRNSPTTADKILLDIYVISRERETHKINVSESMSAQEVLDIVLEKTKVPHKNFAVFECICKEELERPLHPHEKVLSVTLRWSEWPEEFRKDNYLCVKENHVYENIDLVFDPHSSLFSELKFSPVDKKFKFKFCFEFSQMKMSYKKDARATSYLCSWNVEDLTVYVGVQRKRNPPTGWCFTFINKDEKVVGPYFGSSVCCNSKEELYRWLAAILHGQSPMGFRPGARPPPEGAACQVTHADAGGYSLEQPVPDGPLGSPESVVGGPPIPGRIKGFKSSFINKFIKR